MNNNNNNNYTFNKNKNNNYSYHNHLEQVSFQDQLKIVWQALCSWQRKHKNVHPTRQEMYETMMKIRPSFMNDKDPMWAEEAIDACLAFGTVEEMIIGRVSPLYITPIILHVLTNEESPLYQQCRAKDGSHIYLTLAKLNNHLENCQEYKKLEADKTPTYFTLHYLYRTISNASRLFAFHKDDKHKNGENMNDEQLKLIRFRVRSNAYNANREQNKLSNNNNKYKQQQQQQQYLYDDNNQYHQQLNNNNNYYHQNNNRYYYS